MELIKAEKLARDLMNLHGLSDWMFGFNRRKRSGGICRYHKKRIELSKYVTELNEEYIIKNTILHEIAHALCSAEVHHGWQWKAKCREIGAIPSRCMPFKELKKPALKYLATCPECGHNSYYNTIKDVSCGECCRSYNPIYKMKFKKVKK